jgi:predicted secreted protein
MAGIAKQQTVEVRLFAVFSHNTDTQQYEATMFTGAVLSAPTVRELLRKVDEYVGDEDDGA